MMTSSSRIVTPRSAAALATVVAIAVLAYGIGSARAGGAPASVPLVYAGTILVDEAADTAATRSVVVELWPALSGGTRLCVVGPTVVPLINGRFELPLDDAGRCEAAVRADPEVYVSLTIDSTPIPGRMRLNAVPYALEADHAVASDSSTSAARHIASRGGSTISVGGTYCGEVPVSLGDMGGYATASALCGARPGCTPTAHLCSGDELIRGAMMGIAPVSSSVRYVTGTWAAEGTREIGDCLGLTSSAGTVGQRVWVTSLGAPLGTPGTSACNNGIPTACCD